MQVERWLNVPPSVRLVIEGMRGAVEVDGHRVTPGWEGYYFQGMRVTLAVPPELTYAFSHWVVNGAEIKDTTLTLEAAAPLEIEPIWARGVRLTRAPCRAVAIIASFIHEADTDAWVSGSF